MLKFGVALARSIMRAFHIFIDTNNQYTISFAAWVPKLRIRIRWIEAFVVLLRRLAAILFSCATNALPLPFYYFFFSFPFFLLHLFYSLFYVTKGGWRLLLPVWIFLFFFYFALLAYICGHHIESALSLPTFWLSFTYGNSNQNHQAGCILLVTTESSWCVLAVCAAFTPPRFQQRRPPGITIKRNHINYYTKGSI